MSAQPEPRWSLRDFVKAHLEASDELDPGKLAAEIAASVPERDLRWYLETALRRYIDDIQRTEAHTARRNAAEDGDADGVVVPLTPPSRWGAHVGQVVRSYLSQVVVVGDSERIRLGDCTPEQVNMLAQVRHEMALANAKESKRFTLLREAMQKQHSATVADLPETVLLEILRWKP